MSQTYLPDEDPLAYIDPDEEYTAQHSGDPPHHHHHHHRHEHHKHEHHKHEGNNHVGTLNMGDPNLVGTVAHAIEHIQACIKALPNKRLKYLALGHACARLIESDQIDGMSEVLREATISVNRYAHVAD